MPKSLVFTYGRFQPPTISHMMLIRKVIDHANQNNADHFICMSHKVDKTENPLTYAEKADILRCADHDVRIFNNDTLKTPFMVLEYFATQYNDITLYVGDDRLENFTSRMAPYVLLWGIDKFNILSAGKRNTNSLIESMSGTRARHYAKTGDYTQFKKCLPISLPTKVCINTYDAIRGRI